MGRDVKDGTLVRVNVAVAEPEHQYAMVVTIDNMVYSDVLQRVEPDRLLDDVTDALIPFFSSAHTANGITKDAARAVLVALGVPL